MVCISLVYNTSHSVTFIQGEVSSGYSVRRSWIDFHLIPEEPPVVQTHSPQNYIIDIPFTSKSVDYTNAIAKELYFSPTNGEWSFYIDHDKWLTWYETKKEIEDYINGKRLWCVLEDDPGYMYNGRFVVSNWTDGEDYSEVTIGYDIDRYKEVNGFTSYDKVPIYYKDTITDSWEEIGKSIKDGSYTTKYNLGDIKNVEIKGIYGYMPMQIVAFNADTNSSTYNKAAITWISKESLIIPSDNLGNNNVLWYNTNVYKMLNNDIYPRLPSTVQNLIKSVVKYHYSPSYPNAVTYVKIWNPSIQEVIGNGSNREPSNAPTYVGFLNTMQSRKRQIHSRSINGSYSSWWLRSIATNGNYTRVTGDTGSVNDQASSNTKLPVVFGFCT